MKKQNKTSDSLLFSANKIELAYTHVIKELKIATFDEEDVIIRLLPFLNGSLETRAFSLRYKSKAQVKELLENEIIDLYGNEKEESKTLMPGASPKNSIISGMLGRGVNKESCTKATVNLPKSIIP